MLVLSRLRNEKIRIGSDIVVEIVDIRGDKVRLGITAHPDIPVHREEVFEAILREGGEIRPAISGDIPAAEAVCDPPVGRQGPQYLGMDEVV